jgi:hypothetical protein
MDHKPKECTKHGYCAAHLVVRAFRFEALLLKSDRSLRKCHTNLLGRRSSGWNYSKTVTVFIVKVNYDSLFGTQGVMASLKR